MKRLAAILAAMAMSVPAIADPDIKQWNTYHSMGCMLLRECTDGTTKVESVSDLQTVYPDLDLTEESEELDDIFTQMNTIGIDVYVADGKYFPRNHRAVYHTEGNRFFYNNDYMDSGEVVLDLTRHEGWHAAQDCMAGSIDNNNIAIIWNDGVIPASYTLRADVAYGGGPAVPWEAEAFWAMDNPYATANALRACASTEGAMWDVYVPTPMTGEWLIENGYWDGVTR